MPLDTRIPLMSQTLDLASIDQAAQRGRLQDLKMRVLNQNMASSSELQGLKIQGLRQSMADRKSLRDLIPQAVSGDASARAQAIGINPDLYDTFSKMDAAQLEQVKTRNQQIGRIAASVMQSDNPPAAYQQARQYAIQELGLSPEQVPEQFDPSFLQNAMNQAREVDDIIKQREVQLQEIYDPNSPTGTRFVTERDAIGQPGKPGSGLKFESTPGGGFTLTQGRMGPDMSTKTQGELEGRLLDVGDMQARLEGIRESFNPEFLQIPTRIDMALDTAKEKWGFDVSPEERKVLAEFNTMKRRTLENLNLYIRQLSGAAMTEGEAARLKPTMPNVGTGIFDGDSKTEFKTKLDDVTGRLQAVTSRYQDLLQNGIIQPGGKVTPEIAREHPLEAYLQGGVEPVRFDTPESVGSVDFETLRGFAAGADAQTLEALPDEVRDAMAERLRSGK